MTMANNTHVSDYWEFTCSQLEGPQVHLPEGEKPDLETDHTQANTTPLEYRIGRTAVGKIRYRSLESASENAVEAMFGVFSLKM